MANLGEIAGTLRMLPSKIARKALEGKFAQGQLARAEYDVNHPDNTTGVYVDKVRIRGFNPIFRRYQTLVLESHYHKIGTIIYFPERCLS